MSKQRVKWVLRSTVERAPRKGESFLMIGKRPKAVIA